MTMRRCQDEKVRRWEDVKMRKFEHEEREKFQKFLEKGNERPCSIRSTLSADTLEIMQKSFEGWPRTCVLLSGHLLQTNFPAGVFSFFSLCKNVLSDFLTCNLSEFFFQILLYQFQVMKSWLKKNIQIEKKQRNPFVFHENSVNTAEKTKRSPFDFRKFSINTFENKKRPLNSSTTLKEKNEEKYFFSLKFAPLSHQTDVEHQKLRKNFFSPTWTLSHETDAEHQKLLQYCDFRLCGQTRKIFVCYFHWFFITFVLLSSILPLLNPPLHVCGTQKQTWYSTLGHVSMETQIRQCRHKSILSVVEFLSSFAQFLSLFAHIFVCKMCLNLPQGQKPVLSLRSQKALERSTGHSICNGPGLDQCKNFLAQQF